MLLAFRLGLIATLATAAVAQTGIPVTDSIVLAKCGACHKTDARGIMARVSFARSTPEGWQNVIKQMVLRHDMVVTAEEARTIVRYLSAAQGLAPEEAKPLMYGVERRIRNEQRMGQALVRECGRCHTLAQTLSWRRPANDWQEVANTHAAQYKIQPSADALAALSRVTALDSPEWRAWSATPKVAQVAGRWLISANLPGRGRYVGELSVTPSGNPDEFNTRAILKSTRDGSILQRTGKAAVYAGYAWRGRSKGSTAATSADDPVSEVREVMWISPDQNKAEGRWYWGQYQEFGFDIQLQRPTDQPTLLATAPAALRTGSTARLRFFGDHLPAALKPTDVNLGPGVSLKQVVSQTANETVIDVEVAADAPLGKRQVTLTGIPASFVVFDRVDYIKISPDSAVATFGDADRARGYTQFEAIGVFRGKDGANETPDDLDLDPVDVTWSMELTYDSQNHNLDSVGTLSPGGLFIPGAQTSHSNFDLWVIATTKSEKGSDGAAMTDRSSLVLTVPTYMLNGRRYIRDLDRWIDDGPEKPNQ